MNLAIRDIRHKLSRFLLTAVGIGLLLMIVMGMAGIYQGLSEDALSFLERTKADLWIVQKGTRGPFAEISRIPGIWKIAPTRSRASPARGPSSPTPFSGNSRGKPLRIVVQGLAWPRDDGSALPLIAGRALRPGALRDARRPHAGPASWATAFPWARISTPSWASRPAWSARAATGLRSSRSRIRSPSSTIRRGKRSAWSGRRGAHG